MAESVQTRWRALLEADRPEMREVSSSSALRMVFGVNEFSQPYFFVVVEVRPRAPQVSSAIAIEIGQRASDGKWTLTLRLVDRALTDAFISLLSEIAEQSAAERTTQAAWSLFVRLLVDLQHLLVPRRERLSLDALRGLIAELWFGFDAAAHGQSLEAAVMGWNGPFGGDQDFNFPLPAKQYEVKSRRPTRTTVEISSATQLDRDDVDLAVVTIDDTSSTAAGVTLPGLVSAVRALLDSSTRAEFDKRFAELAIELGDPWYRDQYFRVIGLTTYEVRDDFPRLRCSQLPGAIAKASYRLDLNELSAYLLSDRSYDEPRAAT